MKVSFKNLKEQTFYEDFSALRKAYGERMAEKILDRIDDLLRADNPQKLPPSARFHEHDGKRSGLFSLDLVHPFRLIVQPDCEYAAYVEIISVEIYEVFNPHK
jgi:proteic killer suppression protein